MLLPEYPCCGYMKRHYKISGLRSNRNEIRCLHLRCLHLRGLRVKPHSAEFGFLTE